MLKYYEAKNDTEVEQAAFGDALCEKYASNITPFPASYRICLPFNHLLLWSWDRGYFLVNQLTTTLACVVHFLFTDEVKLKLKATHFSTK